MNEVMTKAETVVQIILKLSELYKDQLVSR